MFPSVISFAVLASPVIFRCSCYWSHFITVNTLTALLCTSFIISFQGGQNCIQKCSFSISLHNTFLSFKQQFIQKRTFVPWHLSISKSLQWGMCRMAFINPGKLDQVDLPFHAVYGGWIWQIFLDAKYYFSTCLLFFDYSIYQLSQIDVTPMSLKELSSVEYVWEGRQDGWFLYKTCIITTPKKAQAIHTISVTLNAH